MRPPESRTVTELLKAWGEGDRAALDELVPVVYGELRRQAERHMRREPQGHTLQTTALVHEAYLRLVDQESARWQNRAQFFGVAAQLMRRILIDHARARQAAKRGGAPGPPSRLTLGAASEVASEEPAADVLALDAALERLTAFAPAQGRLVELRYFGGLSIEETAAVLGVSPATVKREWSAARAWLKRELGVS
jgi:RNA polymerase sigma-70 factor, ECF subfamily